MGKLTNALQGKLNSRKGHVKDPSKSQLDLFSSLSDRKATTPKIVMSKSETPAPLRPEREMILPPSAGTPPDVSADVRAVLSESGPARPVETMAESGEGPPPLRTGIYHRPQRPTVPASRPSEPRSPSGLRLPLAARMRIWFAGVELDRRMVSLILVLCVSMALIGFWTARPRPEKELPAMAEPFSETLPVEETGATTAAAAVSTASPAAPSAAALVPASAEWKIPGTETFRSGDALLIRFSAPVFVSGDKISVEGMRALKAVAAKLVTLKPGTRVRVTGHTDDVPLGQPTPQFKSNADIAAARAKVATEHLAQFARAGKGLIFESRAGDLTQAPFPNDSPRNRRLNRTATVDVILAP